MSVLHKGGGVAAAVAASVLSAFGNEEDSRRPSAADIEGAPIVASANVMSVDKSCYSFGTGSVTRITCLPEMRK